VHYVYVVACSDDTYYTGYTTDVERRVAEHDAGDGAKYTRGRTPVTLQYVEAFESQSAAMSREHEIKQFTRARKETLVASQNDPWTRVVGDA
jgi:putative endonuclease